LHINTVAVSAMIMIRTPPTVTTMIIISLSLTFARMPLLAETFPAEIIPNMSPVVAELAFEMVLCILFVLPANELVGEELPPLDVGDPFEVPAAVLLLGAPLEVEVGAEVAPFEFDEAALVVDAPATEEDEVSEAIGQVLLTVPPNCPHGKACCSQLENPEDT